MTGTKYAAKGTGRQQPPPLPEPAQRDSGTRLSRPEPEPSTHFAPLPLGSDAFAPPMAPAAEEYEPTERRWLRPLAAIGATGVLGAVIALTLVLRREAPDIAPEPVHTARAPISDSSPTGAVVIAAAAPAELPGAVAPSLPPVAVAPSLPARPAIASAPADDSEAPAETGSRREHRSRRSARAKDKDKETLPDKPSRAQVIATMARVQRQAKACFPSGRGSVTADLKVIGRTGRVTTAQVSGQSGAIGSCVAQAVRKAKFPKFSDESLSVRYPMAF